MEIYSNVIVTFLKISNQIKLYHWQTLSHPRHLATNDFIDKFDELVDSFVETLHGNLIAKSNNAFRIQLTEHRIKLDNLNDDDALEFIKKIKVFLEKGEIKNITDNCTDLQNIRDEMLALVNKQIYLFTLT